jgi:hypothetical protein
VVAAGVVMDRDGQYRVLPAVVGLCCECMCAALVRFCVTVSAHEESIRHAKSVIARVRVSISRGCIFSEQCALVRDGRFGRSNTTRRVQAGIVCDRFW